MKKGKWRKSIILALLLLVAGMSSGCVEEQAEHADHVTGKGRGNTVTAEEVLSPVITSSEQTRDIDKLFAGEGIYCIYTDESYRYITKDGELLNADTYTTAYPFHEGLACVCKDGKYGYIDREGNTALDFVYDRATPFVEGLAYFCIGDSYGFMDRTGTPLFSPDCDSVSTFQEGLAFICVNGKYGYIDTMGEIVIEPQYEDADYFQDGLALVMWDHQKGIIDREGQWVIAPEYLEIEREEEYLVAEKNGKYDIFDWEGNSLLEEACDSVFKWWDGFLEFAYEEQNRTGFIYQGKAVLLDESYDPVRPLLDRELIIARLEGSYGVIDFQGEIKIPFQYSYIRYDEEAGFFLVTDTDQKKYILDGDDFSRRAECHYDSVSSYVNGQAVVEMEGKYGVADLDGNLIEPGGYDLIRLLENGARWYRKNSVSYLYDEDGKLLNTGNYGDISYWNCGYMVTNGDFYVGFLNTAGEEVLTPEYYITYGINYDNSDILLLRSIEDYNRYVIVDTGQRQEEETVSDILLRSEITPRDGKLWEALQNGSITVNESAYIHKTFYSEQNGASESYRIYDLGRWDSPVLYAYESPFVQTGPGWLSYGGFFTWQGQEPVCLLSGYECGGTGGGNYLCLWYDTEDEELLLGDFGYGGGFQGYTSYAHIYDYEDGKLSLRTFWQYISQSVGNYDEEELTANAELYYDVDGRPLTRETISEASAITEYSVNGELTTKEHYQEISQRYEEVVLPR